MNLVCSALSLENRSPVQFCTGPSNIHFRLCHRSPPWLLNGLSTHTTFFSFFFNVYIDVQSCCNKQTKNKLEVFFLWDLEKILMEVFTFFGLFWQNRLLGYCYYLANYDISLIKCFSCKPRCLDIRCWNKLYKSMLMSSPFHFTVRLASFWYDVPVTSHTPFLGATNRLSAAFPKHYIRSTVAMSWLEYFIRCQPAICWADEHTTFPTYSRQSVTVHQPAARHHAPSHPFFWGASKSERTVLMLFVCCCL